jgi:hypothetical protein
MDWHEEVAQFASAKRLLLVTASSGVGIEFSDGCDVFWILPGETTSTLPVLAEGPNNLAVLLAEFDRIDHLRERALHVIRHYLASLKMYVNRRRSGEWGVMGPEGASSEICVGAMVTAKATQGLDVYQLVAACFEGSFIRHPPSPRRIDRYLAVEGPPAEERPFPEEAPTIDVKWNLHSAVTTSGLLRALDTLADAEVLPSPEQLVEAAVPKSLLGKTLLHVAQRLPQPEASWDCSDSGFQIDFDDKLDSYRILPKSKAFVQQVRSLGPQATGDQVADEYLKINSARKVVLAAVKRAAAAHHWNMQQILRSFLANMPTRWYIGATRREITIYVGEQLTDALRSLPPDQAIRQLLTGHPDFAEECIRSLDDAGEPADLPQKELSPNPPMEQPPLCELDAATIAELDAFADRAVANYFQEERVIWDYGDREIFDPLADTWASMSDWVQVAERHLDGEWPNANAIIILLDARDSRGVELARRYLARAEPHHEVSQAEIELAWRFRHELSDMARRWFLPQPFDQVPFPEVRARLGDPVAQRFLATNEGFDVLDESTWTDRMNPAIVVADLPETVREQVHQRLLDWARNSWRWAPPEEWALRGALWLGLPDVADALDENLFLRSGLLCRGSRPEMFDEPGILLSSKLLYLWSKLKPTNLLAQIVASVHYGDMLELAEKVNRDVAARNPRAAKSVPMALQVLQKWNQDLQTPLAIAWKRYRAVHLGRSARFTGLPAEGGNRPAVDGG